ncbi:MAG: sensor histidine kinase [Bacteroidia bacterium]|nr:sensor histidine kinase [Bacteroidia bacterium]
MKIRLIICLLYVLIFNLCFAQQQTDIKHLLLDVKDASFFDSTLMFRKGQEAISLSSLNETKAEVHLYYGSYFFYTHRLEKAIEYFKLSLKEAELAKSRHWINLAKIRLVYMQFEKGNKIKSEKALYQLLEIAQLEKDYSNILELYNLLGIIKESKNEIKKAAELYYSGLSLSEEKKLEYYQGVFKNNLGLIKLGSGQIKEALSDFYVGLKLAEKGNNKRLANHLKLNICLAQILNKESDKARVVLNEAIIYTKNNNLPRELSNIYANTGSTFFNNKEYDIANCYYDSSIAILNKNNLLNELSHAYMGKILILFETNNITEAEKYLELTNEVIVRTNNLEAKSNYCYLLYKKEFIKKNYEKSLENYLNYIKIRDSINNNLNNKIIEDLQYNYKVQQKEAELEKEKTRSMLLEISNQKEKNNKWLVIGIAIIILITIVIYYYNRYLRKLKEEQEQFSRLLIMNIEQERKRISMDLHDDIGQSLSIIKSKVINNLQSDEIQDELAKVINQTREISRNLYPSNLEKIGLIRAIASLMQDLQSLKTLECSYDIDESVLSLSIDIQTNIFRIVQECVNNTIKHSGASGLKASIKKINDEFVFTYMDNGIGLKNKRNIGGMGILSIQERAKIINGNVEIEEKNEKGFRLTLKFKQ